MAKVRALPDLRLLPAHGPVTESSHARIDELVAFHDVRLADSLTAVEAGARTAWQVARSCPGPAASGAHELNPFDSGRRRSRRSPTSSCSRSGAT